jgi:hypothetical protein
MQMTIMTLLAKDKHARAVTSVFRVNNSRNFSIKRIQFCNEVFLHDDVTWKKNGGNFKFQDTQDTEEDFLQ